MSKNEEIYYYNINRIDYITRNKINKRGEQDIKINSRVEGIPLLHIQKEIPHLDKSTLFGKDSGLFSPDALLNPGSTHILAQFTNIISLPTPLRNNLSSIQSFVCGKALCLKNIRTHDSFAHLFIAALRL